MNRPETAWPEWMGFDSGGTDSRRGPATVGATSADRAVAPMASHDPPSRNKVVQGKTGGPPAAPVKSTVEKPSPVKAGDQASVPAKVGGPEAARMAAGDPTASKVKAGDKVAVHQSLTGLFDRGTRAGAVTPPPPPTEPTGEEAGPLLPPTDPPTVLSVAQKVGFCVVGVALIAGLVVATTATLIAVMAVLVLFFMASNLMKLVMISKALNHPHQVTVDVTSDRMEDSLLPIYTILLPVYHEPTMLTQLVDGILSLDYPEDRLDVKLLVESDDDETREAATALVLPDCFEILVVPDAGPTGKPRACNHGLVHARGKYLVIYDAEDRPEADQLRKSVLAFTKAEPEVVCLQAQLNYFNRSHNLLTRWFTGEYSVWFDQFLPGLQAMDVVIPLGGTSNHFITAKLLEVGGWNAFNVTEDADLGLRIYLQGWKTAVLETTTYEEATSRYRNWIRQRSRWVKGYMQTYLFHMRRPVNLARQMGAKSFVAFQLFFGAGTLCLLLNPIFWALAIVWFATRLHLIQTIFPWPVLYLGTLGLIVGNAACVLSVVSGCFGRRNYGDVKYALLVPVYWVLMSVGAWKALIQLFTKPSYWEKTEHGFCRFEDPADVPELPTEPVLADTLTAS